jgi:short-subunit dehydrogenase
MYIFIQYLFLVVIFSFFIRLVYRKFQIKNQKYLNDKIFVCITGGCLGIGKEIIKILINQYSCNVINIDIRGDLFEGLHSEIEIDKRNKLHNFMFDLSLTGEIEKVFSNIIAKFGKIDILINNAGVAYNKKFQNLEEDEYLNTIRVNLIAPVVLTKKFILNYSKNQIHVVNMASVMSHTISDKSPDYISSKWGLYSFHECLRYDYYDNENIYFTVICPFAVDTGMFPGFKPPISILEILKAENVARDVVNTIILKDKIVFIPFYLEYVCYLFKLLPVALRDFLYFKLSKSYQ